MPNHNYLASLLLTCGFVAISGCTNLINLSIASDDIVTIEQIKNEELLDTTLTITGKVEKVVPLVNSSAYAISDGNELIWVTTNEKPPTISTEITIEATVQNKMITIDQQQYPEYYLAEVQRISESEVDVEAQPQEPQIEVEELVEETQPQVEVEELVEENQPQVESIENFVEQSTEVEEK